MDADRALADFVCLVDGYRRLERRCAELEGAKVNADRFYNWAADVETVAAMHGVSRYLVREYIKLGLIEAHPDSTDARFLVRGSVALLLDFDALRAEARHTRQNSKYARQLKIRQEYPPKDKL